MQEIEGEINFNLSYEIDPEMFVISITRGNDAFFKLCMDQDQFEAISCEMIRIIQKCNLRKANDYRERQAKALESN